MPQLELIPQEWAQSSGKASTALLDLEAQSNAETARFTFEAIKPGIFRTNFWSESHVLPPYPSVKEPKIERPDSTSSISNNKLTVDTGDVEATVNFEGAPVVSLRFKNSEIPIHEDLSDRSYVFDGNGVSHYIKHDRKALHVGLGEKSAPMDLTARGFRIDATDCFGYEAYRTDPMYKHIPLLVKATPEGCVGIFSSSHSRGYWSVGAEIDGLWGHFKVYRQDYGGLQEYLLVGKTLKDVVRLYAEIAGFPLLAPRWAFGYISGGYKYTMKDDPPAYQELLNFADKLEEHDIPCSAHQMSSGYSIAETEPRVRNVFTWNKHRFPDPEGWLSKYHSKGIRLLTNIKPYILASHPDYQYLADSGALFRDPSTGQTASMKLWSAGGGESGLGSHIDFTSEAGGEWWSRGVSMLKRQGVDGMWNDNNEYTLPRDDWQMALEDAPSKENNHVGLWGRAMHCELMAKRSYEGLLKVAPNERPFVLTRSGSPGTFRYACSSWSGDNTTSWEDMKGANAISLTAGVSLMQCYGHDCGGFEGPQPTPELLLRWVQLSCHMSRFAINCFKTSPEDNQAGEVIEPWMYPEITPLIRDAIKRRYEMMPYIYSLALESHMTASPPQRWVGWGYESDPEVWTKELKRGEEQFWFGDTLLIGGVYEAGKNAARVYLPRRDQDPHDHGFLNTNAPYEHLKSGQWASIASPWKESIPVLAKVGGAVPIGKPAQTLMPGEKAPACKTLEEDNHRGIEIFPPPMTSTEGHTFHTTWYEDDGISLETNISAFTISYSSTEDKVIVGFSTDTRNTFQPRWLGSLDVILPVKESRLPVSSKGVPLTRLGNTAKGCPRYRITLDKRSKL